MEEIQPHIFEIQKRGPAGFCLHEIRTILENAVKGVGGKEEK